MKITNTWFGPTNFTQIKAVKRKGKISDELYSKIDEILFRDVVGMSLGEKNRWIHLRDAVNCGTVTPMEAYDCVAAGFVPEHLLVRDSNYSHLV